MTKKQALLILSLSEQNGFKFLFTFLAACLSITGALPGYGQRNIGPAVERVVMQKPISVPALSHQANLAVRQKLQPLFSRTPLLSLKGPKATFPQELSGAVFQVQKGPLGRSSASAFALEIDGRIWGVTAAHVMSNILIDPYAKVQNPYGKELTAPITSWQSTPAKLPAHAQTKIEHSKHLSAPITYWYSSEKTDVAIFEIPAELKPYIQVLRPLQTRPQAQQMATVLGFVQGSPLYLPTEEILFSGPYRLLLRALVRREMTGFCGSPVLVNGQVAGLHVGSSRPQEAKQTYWYELLRGFFDQDPPSMHLAAPIEAVQLLAREFTSGPSADTGVVMKVLNHPVALLTPREQLYSVQHLRNGLVKNTLYAHPFMDPEKLEQFFELEEEDILRITVFDPKRQNIPAMNHIYEINVSTGQVTRRDKRLSF